MDGDCLEPPGGIAFGQLTPAWKEQSMTSFSITPLTDHTAAEVTGLDFTQPISGKIRADLNQAFARHHVLVMRDQRFDPEQFVAAAQIFGELHPHDKKERHVPGHPKVEYISNQEVVNGRRLIPGETFHTDHSNHPRPPKATTLFAVELPSSGGDTQYVNMHLAYDELPEDTKRRIDGLKAVHVYLSKYSPRPLGQISDESRRNLPPPESIRWFAPILRMAARRYFSIRCASNRSSEWRTRKRLL